MRKLLLCLAVVAALAARTRADTARNVGFALGRMANKLIKATREKINKP